MDRWKARAHERITSRNADARHACTHACMYVCMYVRALQEIRRTWNSRASAMYRDVPGISWNFETPGVKGSFARERDIE